MAKRRSRKHFKVFLSHSHKDRWIAKQCARLIELGAIWQYKAIDLNDFDQYTDQLVKRASR